MERPQAMTTKTDLLRLAMEGVSHFVQWTVAPSIVATESFGDVFKREQVKHWHRMIEAIEKMPEDATHTAPFDEIRAKWRESDGFAKPNQTKETSDDQPK
jgi:hypothetical protein